MTKHTPATPNIVDAFYAAPSPVGAVKVAIADHKASNPFPIWEYVEQLQKAEARCIAYPQLVAALRDLIAPACGGYADGFPDGGEADAATALLRSLGEDA